MIFRALFFASILPLSALADIQVDVLNGSTLTPIGSSFFVGTTTVGQTATIQFRVQNSASVEVPLTASVTGSGFSMPESECQPAPIIPPNKENAFCVVFTPTIVALYAGTLVVSSPNTTLNILLTGTATGAAAPTGQITVSDSSGSLAYGAQIPFGSVLVGNHQPETITLSNSTNASVTVNSVSVSGTGFSGPPMGIMTPLQIAPRKSVPFDITFSPTTATRYPGTLTVDSLSFNLKGQGQVPPLPGASIVLASTVGASAQQNSITIQLASASQVSGNGTLTMAFLPSVAGVTDDAAVQVLSGPAHIATVAIAAGATSATIGGQSSMAFQTGTTAGTITFTLTLNGDPPQQASLTIPPAPIDLDSATAVRLFGSLNVAFSGFDNTYSASQISYTFYDIKGKALPQGAIDVNAATDFQQYFSTTQVGGMFQVLAVFPVTGNEAEIGFVTAQVTNSLGTTSVQQVPFGN
jgi:hypothetical protein